MVKGVGGSKRRTVSRRSAIASVYGKVRILPKKKALRSPRQSSVIVCSGCLTQAKRRSVHGWSSDAERMRVLCFFKGRGVRDGGEGVEGREREAGKEKKRGGGRQESDPTHL